MVDDEMAEQAYVALKMVFGELAMYAADFGADASPATADLKIGELRQIAKVGRDIALAADAAAMALRRAYGLEN